MNQLYFYFDYSSPFAYLGATQIAAAAARHDAELHLRPFLLGGLFRAIGTPMVPMQVMTPPKQRHASQDMFRWARHYGVPFAFPSRFPMNSVTPLRMTLQLEGEAQARFMERVFAGYWAEDRDIASPEVLTALAAELGLDGAALLAGCQDPAVKTKLHEATAEAEAQGVCGAPSYRVETDDGERYLFWGQDRLDLVERVLDGWRPPAG
ncbi:MAG: 2-hydroxychromene-2-carboxylate isomerase [Polyangiaceae bacterium]